MKPIKVLYYYSSAQIDTGSPRAMLRMIDSLDRKRFQPAFLASGNGSLIDELRSRNVEIIPGTVASVSWRNPLRFCAGIIGKYLILKRFNIDLIHMNEPGWNGDLILAAGISRIPVVLHLHNPTTIAKKNLNYKIASKIFLCSMAQSNETVNFNEIREKCAVLHNAIDIGHFAGGRPIREAIGLAKDDVVIGTIAQIRHGKGLDLFLDTAERLLGNDRKLKFVIVGPKAGNEEAFYQSFLERIGKSPLRENVIYLGSRTDVPDILASLDVFFLPTRAETFGIVVIEAMAAGVPVVVSAVGGIPEIITSREIGRTVSELSAEAYANAIDELLRMGGELKMLGERGRQSLYGRLDLERMRATLGAVYEDLVAQ